MSAPRKLRVAVLFGGRSAEHEISLLSARNVVEALDRDRFEPVLIGIDKTGRWLLQEEALLLGASRDPRLARLNQSAPDVALLAHPSPTGDAALTVGGAAQAIDVVFPVLHGPMGEDGSVQGLLELAGVPYVGSGVLGSAVGMDKDVMKRLLAQDELPLVPYETVRRLAWEREPSEVLARCERLALPLFVKPANLGSSVGVTKVKTYEALADAISLAFEYDTKIVVEQGVEGAREIECAVLGDEEPIVSIPGEIVVDHPDGFYSYAAKYIDERGVTTRVPADLTDAETRAVQLLALRTFRVLEASGLARIDLFMSKSGEVYVNEINTLPGFTSISMYPKLWEASGIPPRELVARLIDLALGRAERRRKLKTST
ncbi:D-alanine--D-alanine ligase family protein [Polyangium sorediatum]|uniref:D-alanine--D-alanine ligase n=1 Tax=Polyangium sorediatum TaxID=889274 RepID=A0ABT6NIG1_9BACT|nr:D-alanine--D-alanine ligase family protein [Polyangium sorediatum]MDI1428096.1 D-alanine--D-alanine ligase family protein [Polyangium sorediatum]